MLKKNNFMWSHKAENAFMELKQMMVQGSVLALTDFTKTFITICDASDSGVCAVLMQEK